MTSLLYRAPVRVAIVFAVVALVVTSMARSARADEIVLRGGGTVEGKILEETPAAVKIKTRFGVQTYPRAKIVKVVYKKTRREEFDERFAKVDKKDAAALMALAEWAREQGLTRERKTVLRAVIAADPEHVAAHKALGHVRVDGEWMSKQDAARAKADREAADKRAKGMVRYKGEWVTREEMEAREKGWVKVGDKWLPLEEANRARGLVKIGEEWVPAEEADARRAALELQGALGVELVAAATKNFRVFSQFDKEHAQQVAEACEKVLTAINEKMGYRGRGAPPQTPYPVYLFKTSKPYRLFVDRMAKQTRQSQAWAKHAKKNQGFWIYRPPINCDFLGHRRQPDVIHGVVFNQGWLCLEQMSGAFTYPPNWLSVGMGMWAEMQALGSSKSTASTFGYGKKKAAKDRWSKSELWKEALKVAVGEHRDTPLDSLLLKGLNELERGDLPKCWSVVDWLIETRPAEFRKYAQRVRREFPSCTEHESVSPKKIRDADARAFEHAFGKTPGEIDAEWRAYVSANY